MATLGDRLRAARKAQKLKQGELGGAIGESTATVSNWERGMNKPDIDKVIRICQVLNVPPADLLDCYVGQETETPTAEEQTRLRRIRALDDDGRAAVDAVLAVEFIRCTRQPEADSDAPEWKMLNLYAPPAAAGPGSPLWDDEPEPIRVELTPAARRADFAVRIVGNSMEPNFRDGDLVLVQHTPTLEPGQLGIFEVDGQAYFKKLGDGELLSLNRDCPDVPLSEESPGRVLGRVLGRAERIGE